MLVSQLIKALQAYPGDLPVGIVDPEAFTMVAQGFRLEQGIQCENCGYIMEEVHNECPECRRGRAEDSVLLYLEG